MLAQKHQQPCSYQYLLLPVQGYAFSIACAAEHVCDLHVSQEVHQDPKATVDSFLYALGSRVTQTAGDENAIHHYGLARPNAYLENLACLRDATKPCRIATQQLCRGSSTFITNHYNHQSKMDPITGLVHSEKSFRAIHFGIL